MELDPATQSMEKIDLPINPVCDDALSVGFILPQKLPDGRLGYISQCPGSDFKHDHHFLMAYDFGTKEVTQLVKNELPVLLTAANGAGNITCQLQYASLSHYSWHPSMELGILGGTWVPTLDSTAFCTGLCFQILASGVKVLGGFDGYGPVWSPDGEYIAYFRPEYTSFYDELSGYTLMLLNKDFSDAKPLVSAIDDWSQSCLAWWPDSKWIVYSKTYGRSDTYDNKLDPDDGLWLVSASSGESRMITMGNYECPNWSGDGERIVASLHQSKNIYDQTLVIFQIGDLIRELTP